MHIARHITIDLVRALGVLALIFLSFGHAPAAVGTTSHDILTAQVDQSFCGGVPSGNDDPHAPCHACRVGIAVLPPPCGGLLHRPVIAPLELTRAALPSARDPILGLPQPRGPPRLA